MLLSNNRLNHARIASRQNEATIAVVDSVVINPANLEIDCMWVTDRLNGKDMILHRSDIDRAVMHPSSRGPKLGIIITSRDQLIDPKTVDQYVRIKQQLQANYSPIESKVVDTDGNKIGKVNGYNFDNGSLTIVQLIVGSSSITQRATTTGLTIHRSQIREIKDDTIVVASTKGKSKFSWKSLFGLGGQSESKNAKPSLSKEL